MLDNIYRETIPEALLRRAVIQDHENELTSIPPEDELRKMYTFSPQHELRMKALFQKYSEYFFNIAMLVYNAIKRGDANDD